MMSNAEKMFILLEEMLDKANDLESMRMVPPMQQTPLAKVWGEAGAAALRDFAHYFEFRRGDLHNDVDEKEFDMWVTKCKDKRHPHIRWAKNES